MQSLIRLPWALVLAAASTLDCSANARAHLDFLRSLRMTEAIFDIDSLASGATVLCRRYLLQYLRPVTLWEVGKITVRRRTIIAVWIRSRLL